MKLIFFTLTLLTVLTPLTRGATVFVLPNNARATNLTIVGGSASGLTNTGGTFTGGSFTGALTGTNAVLTTPSIAGGTNTGSLITGATITGSLTGTNAVLTTPSIAGGTNTGSLITGATITGSLTGTNAVLTTPSITGGTNTGSLITGATITGSLTGTNAVLTTPSITGGTLTGVTNAGLTVFGSAAVTNSATSKLLIYSNLTALGSLRVGGTADTHTGNSLYGGDAIISGQIFGGGAQQNSGYALALNYEAGSALSPVICFDNRTGTNAQMHMEFRLAGTRKGYVGYLGAASANARMMCINDDAGDGIQFQTGNNASGQGYRFYTGEGGGRYLMKLHPTAGGLAIGSSYYSTAPATNGLNVEGKVGLAVTSPQYQLDIGGTVRLTGSNKLNLGGTSGAADADASIYRSAAGVITLTTNLVITGNFTATGTNYINNTTTSPGLHVAGSGSSYVKLLDINNGFALQVDGGSSIATNNYALDFRVAAQTKFAVFGSGKTAIRDALYIGGLSGFTYPQYPLDVVGAVRITGSNKLNLGGSSGNADADASLARTAAGMITLITNLTVTGSVTVGTQNKTGNYTLTTGDGGIVFADASGGAVTITLPAASASTIGRQYQVFKVDSSGNAVNIAPAGSDSLLANSTTNAVLQANCLRVIGCTATNWIVNRLQ